MTDRQPGLLGGIMMAYLILILHVVLVAGLGVVVILLSGFSQYSIWIFLGGLATFAGSGYFFYRRLKAQGKSLQETLNSPLFKSGKVEISLLGGMASIKIDNRQSKPAVQLPDAPETHRLEDAETIRLRELSELARLLENDLINPDEYNQAKRKLFNE